VDAASNRFVDGAIRTGNCSHALYRPLPGEMTLGRGLAQSINTIAVQVGAARRHPQSVVVAHRLGISSGVCLGNDDHSPTNKVTGGSLPAQTWRRFMLAATQAMPVRPLPAAPAPPPAARVVAVTPPRSGGGLFDNFFGLFGPSQR
jgi:penicillin-binding protein 1A